MSGNDERIHMQGHLAELDMEIKSLKIKIVGLRDQIRGQLYPMTLPEDIRADQVLSAALELAALCVALGEKLAIKQELCKALGR